MSAKKKVYSATNASEKLGLYPKDRILASIIMIAAPSNNNTSCERQTNGRIVAGMGTIFT